MPFCVRNGVLKLKDNLWRKFERVVKPWQLVLAFVIILLFGLYKEANAEANVELGGTFLSGEFSDGGMLVLNETFDDKWVLGMGLTSPQRVEDRKGNVYTPRENLFIHGQRLVGITDNIDFGLGVGYFNATTRWNGSNFVASMSIEYDISENWSVKYRHFSNAGSASPNMGQDAFLVSYSFK